MSRYDALDQVVSAMQLTITESGVRTFPIKLRFAWPSELDLMAKLAGMELEHRWSDWDGSPLTAASGIHVSVWRRG